MIFIESKMNLDKIFPVEKIAIQRMQRNYWEDYSQTKIEQIRVNVEMEELKESRQRKMKVLEHLILKV